MVYGDNLGELTLEIFDRWGQLLFSTQRGEVGWDGYHGGQPAASGTYVYKLTYEDKARKRYRKSGHLTLLR